MPSWDTSTPGYDRRKFYTQASDRKGHYVQVRVNVPTTIAGEIARFLAGGYVEEYGTQSDLVRDAIVHRLWELSQMVNDGTLERTVSMHTIYSQAVAKQVERETFADMVAAIEENCSYYLEQNQITELRTYLEDLLEQREVVPVEHRERYIDVIEQRLKRLNY
jgi:hypothetical protein